MQELIDATVQFTDWATIVSLDSVVSSFQNHHWIVSKIESDYFIRPTRLPLGHFLPSHQQISFLPAIALHDFAYRVGDPVRTQSSVLLTDRLVEMGLPAQLCGHPVGLEIHRKKYMAIEGGIIHNLGYPFTAWVLCQAIKDAVMVRLRYG